MENAIVDWDTLGLTVKKNALLSSTVWTVKKGVTVKTEGGVIRLLAAVLVLRGGMVTDVNIAVPRAGMGSIVLAIVGV